MPKGGRADAEAMARRVSESNREQTGSCHNRARESVREDGLSIPHRHGRSVFKPRSKARDCVLPEVLFAAALP